jgi:HD-GYP domain-containing protein (c-di-GMP phosphodiesterase class II)
MGQPMEHGLRSCLIAARMSEALELEDDERDHIFWVTLLAMVGCISDSYEMTEIFGDDIEFRRGHYDLGPSQFAVPRYYFGIVGAGGGVAQRMRARASLGVGGMRAVMQGYLADCRVTARFADRLGLGERVSAPLELKFARWDGKGIPRGLGGDEIPLPARILAMSWRIESEHRQRGADGAIAVLDRHAGATLDPVLVNAVTPALPEILRALEEESWPAVVAAEPARPRLSGDELERALEAIGDFADLKSPWFTGRSRAVADLAEAAAWRLDFAEPDVTSLRHAALVHAIGRTGIPNTIWDKRGPLTVAERERMQLYPYYTDRILRRGSLAPLAEIAAASQERMNGSGYPKGLPGASIALPARVLAAAHVYQALRQDRPHRPALGRDEAARELRAEAAAGALDSEVAEAVLAAAGHPRERRASSPANLTAREVDVLRLIARGHTSAQAAQELGIHPKTVGTHIEHIYAKIGASNRSVATLFAMQHGLI